MKRVLIAGLAFIMGVSLLVGCGNDSASLEDFVEAIRAEYELFDENTPRFQLIGATEGVLFYIGGRLVDGGQKVAIYEFSSVSALNTAFDNFPMMGEQGWVRNGRFIIETRHAGAIEIFEAQ
ncbi:MAG: hypothetical protein FWB93_02795 [Oscillospiraceae bacterium]|nr:hypothetical protein [Oscillospiraceae bacterium]